MRFVKVTELNGQTAWIVPAWVVMVRPEIKGETGSAAKTAIVLSGPTVFVEDEPEEIVKRLEEAS